MINCLNFRHLRDNGDADAVDYQDNIKGNATIVTESGKVIKGTIIKPTQGGGLTPIVDGKGYVSHFATCPFAGQHRNPCRR